MIIEQHSKDSAHIIMKINIKNLYNIGNNNQIATLFYRPFHKTLPRSSAFINWISVRFYETDCN